MKLSKTKLRYYLGDLDFSDKKLKKVRIAAIDLGLEKLIAMVDNTGNVPLLFKGKKMKAVNHYYNKQKAYCTSILRQDKDLKEGPYTSKRLERITNKRNN